MKRIKLILFSFIFLGLFTPAQAADILAASCSRGDVQTALNLAVEGDRVLVPAGSCTWSTKVNVDNKGITLEGAGIGLTTITLGLTSTALGIFLEPGDAPVNVTGFTFDADNIDTGGSGFISLTGGGLDAFRLHHLEVINLVGTGISINMDGEEVSGLIDHCTIEMPTTNGSKSIRVFGTGPEEHQPFSRPFELGSSKFIFVEDSIFNFGDKNDGALDAFAGARYVFRHNIVNETNVEHHGADSGTFRGIHSFEIYENTFTRTVPTTSRMHYFRSGSGVVFNNTYTGDYSGMVLTIFRADESFAIWGQCDGSSIWDENRPGENGYACLDQPGHIFTATSGGSNVTEGLYEWSNTLNGADVDFSTNGHSAGFYLVEGRDYFNDTVRPGYVPFTYPHPLQVAAPSGPRPDPPTNLRVISID